MNFAKGSKNDAEFCEMKKDMWQFRFFHKILRQFAKMLFFGETDLLEN